MTIDSYAPCPCGSGKKIKFCKCFDQTHDYEKIMRLIEGGQELAALDRINQLLAKSPNAAWLLALKSELALALDEVDVFKEAALRFSKLKPDNPLALTMRSIVSLMDGEPLENAARYLLEGLAESRESLPALVMPALQLLVGGLNNSSRSPLRFYWSQLLLDLRNRLEAPESRVPSVSGVNLLTMTSTLVLPDPPGAQWAERLKEVFALKGAFRFAQAETKLRAILRDFPEQPGPLSHLLSAQMVLLDQDGAITSARKLAQHRDVSLEDRDYYAALALELEPNTASLQMPALSRYCEISSLEEVQEKLSQLPFVEFLPDHLSDEVREGFAASLDDEVPAKHAYNVLSCAVAEAGTTGMAGASGTIVLFGRQTDKPPRALVVLFPVPGLEPLFNQISAALGDGPDLPDPAAPRRYIYLAVLDRARFRPGADGERVMLSYQEASHYAVEEFLNLKFAMLGDLTPLEAVEQEPKRALVRALVTHLEGAHTLLLSQDAIETIYQRLQLDPPARITTFGADGWYPRTLFDFARVDLPSLSGDMLSALMGTAMALDMKRTTYQAAVEVLKRPEDAVPESARASAFELQARLASSLDEAVHCLERLEKSLAKQGKPLGRVLIERCNLLMANGRNEQAQAVFAQGFRDHPKDPEMLSFLQHLALQRNNERGGPGAAVSEGQLLARMGNRLRDDGELEENSSGLVLPGQEPAGDGGSKLWLPGM
jgi:tetratricopeptide (TPR) repeat protein